MIELKNSKTTYLGKASGGDKYALDAFAGAVQMLDPVLGWQDIKPRLVRDADGWHVEGAPYYAEVKDDGSRLFCPDKYERSKYIKFLPHSELLVTNPNVVSNFTVLDSEAWPNEIRMETNFGAYSFLFTNTGMYLPILINSKTAFDARIKDKLEFDIDSTLDVAGLIKSNSGVGIPKARLAESDIDAKDLTLEWEYKNGKLGFGLDLTNKTGTIKILDAIDVQVGASGNDGGRTGGATFNNTQTYQTIGQVSSSDYDAFFRFTGITISGTIDTSYMQFYASSAGVGTPALKIYGVDEDNPAAPTNLTEHDADPLTTAGVDWDGALNNGQWNNTPSLNSIFQELVNSYTISGDAVMVHINDDQASTNQYSQVRTWDYTGNALGAKLHIEYTEGGGATAKTSAETGAGADGSSLLAEMAKSETGSGLDAKGDYPAALLDSQETGSGSELTGLSMDSTALIVSDSGGGIEAVFTRWLEAVETGSGVEAAAVMAALIRGESGAGAEATAATICSSDSGAGSELGILLKTVLIGDDGGGYDALKSLIKTEDSVSDMRLYERQGQERKTSRQEHIPSRQKRMPSKGVNI
jgi:hypothetical protein